MRLIKLITTNELTKLYGRTKYRILPFVMAVALGALFMLVGTDHFLGLSINSFSATVVTVMAKYFLPLVLFMVVADLYASEQANGTIKASMTRPTTRFDLYVSKMVASFLYATFLFSIVMVECFAFQLIVGNLTLSSFNETLFSIIVSLIPMVPVLLMAIVISQIASGESSSVMLSVFVYGVFIAVGTLFPVAYQALFTSYTGWYKLFIGTQLPYQSILNAVAILGSYTLIFSSVGYMLFEKKEY